MPDLKSSTVICVKGALFLVIGTLASSLLLMHAPTLTVAVLLWIAVWGFCRFYYFAFYVIQHYVDEEYRFAGLFSFARYALRRTRQNRRRHD